MKVGDLVVEQIDDRIGTIVKIEKCSIDYGADGMLFATVLFADGSIEQFYTAYLGRY